MTRQTKTKTKTKKVNRIRRSREFKKEALVLVEKVGVAVAIKDLGLVGWQLHGWRNSHKSKASVSEREQALATENTRLKRQIAEQCEALRVPKSIGVLCSESEMKYAFINAHHGEHRLTTLCAERLAKRTGSCLGHRPTDD